MRLLQANAAAERLLGEGFGEPSLDRLPQSFDLLRASGEGALEAGEWPLAEAIRDHQTRLDFQLRNKQSGEVHVIESMSSPVRDESGATRAAVAIMRDLTRALKGQHAAALLESISASSEDAYIALARDGKVTGWNPAAARMFGYAADEIMGHACRRLVSDKAIGRTREITQLMLAGGGPERFELELVRKDGSGLPVMIEAFPVAETLNQRDAFMLICRNMSDRKVLEAEAAAARAAVLEAARSRFAFLIDMSHELRTSLNRISSVVPLLLESPLTAQQRDYASAVAASGEALLATVNDILDLAGLAAGQVELEAERIRSI